MLIGVGPELEWLTGYAAHGHERLNLLVIPAVGAIAYVSPRLEAAAARQAPGNRRGPGPLWRPGRRPRTRSAGPALWLP